MIVATLTQVKNKPKYEGQTSGTKETPRTIDGCVWTINIMANGIESRLGVILHRLKPNCDEDDGGMVEAEPSGILSTLEQVETRMSRTLHLLYAIENVIGIVVPLEGQAKG